MLVKDDLNLQILDVIWDVLPCRRGRCIPWEVSGSGGYVSYSEASDGNSLIAVLFIRAVEAMIHPIAEQIKIYTQSWLLTREPVSAGSACWNIQYKHAIYMYNNGYSRKPHHLGIYRAMEIVHHQCDKIPGGLGWVLVYTQTNIYFK